MRECICRGLNSSCSKCGGGGFLTHKVAHSKKNEGELDRSSTLQKFPRLIQSLGPSLLSNILVELNLQDDQHLTDNDKIDIHYKVLQFKNSIILQTELKATLIGLSDIKKREKFITELKCLDPKNSRDQLSLRELRTIVINEISNEKKLKSASENNPRKQLSPYIISKAKLTFKSKRQRLKIANDFFIDPRWVQIFDQIEFQEKALNKDIHPKSFFDSFNSFLKKINWIPIKYDPQNYLLISDVQVKICAELLIKKFHPVPYDYIHKRVLNSRIFFIRQLLYHLGFHPFPLIKYADLSDSALGILNSLDGSLAKLIKLKNSNVNKNIFQAAEEIISESIQKSLANLNRKISDITVQSYNETSIKKVSITKQKSTEFGSLLSNALEKSRTST